jgi:hypothetical protein
MGLKQEASWCGELVTFTSTSWSRLSECVLFVELMVTTFSFPLTKNG